MSRKKASFLERLRAIDAASVKKWLPVIVFAAISLGFGTTVIHNRGSLAGPDMYDAHYKASLATATGQVFHSSVESGYGRRVPLEGREKYFSSGGDACVGGSGTLVSDQLIKLLASDNQSDCIRQHDKGLSDETVRTTGRLQYPFIGYIPQATGLAFGMVTNMDPVDAQTLARFLNLATYILIISIAIMMISRGRWLLVLLGVLPTSLFLASSLSADSLNIAWGFLFVAYVIRLSTQEKKINKRQMGLISVLGVGLFLLKVAYVPLVLLLLAFDKKRMSTKLKWLLVVGISFVGTLLYAVWSKNWSSLAATVDTSVNMDLILHQFPKAVIGLLANVAYTPLTLFEANGSLYVFIALSIILVIVFSLRNRSYATDGRLFDVIARHKLQILSILIVIGSLGLTYGALLLTWTDIAEQGFMNIQGFQGRYILPLLPLLVTAYYLPDAVRVPRGRKRDNHQVKPETVTKGKSNDHSK